MYRCSNGATADTIRREERMGILLIQTADDDVVWPMSGKRILRRCRGSRKLVMVPEGGHQVLTSESSKAVCEEVEVFLWGKCS